MSSLEHQTFRKKLCDLFISVEQRGSRKFLKGSQLLNNEGFLLWVYKIKWLIYRRSQFMKCNANENKIMFYSLNWHPILTCPRSHWTLENAVLITNEVKYKHANGAFECQELTVAQFGLIGSFFPFSPCRCLSLFEEKTNCEKTSLKTRKHPQMLSKKVHQS